MQRNFERDEQRRRNRQDDDPRDDPRERYGNEEDARSREYRRVYAEDDLPRRLQDDRPYDRPGYEPESGRPGGRENVDLDRTRRGYYGQGQRPGREPIGREGNRGQPAQRDRERQHGQPDYGRSPYEEGDVGAWYGGDTGMGDSGSSQYGNPSGTQAQRQHGNPPAQQFWQQYGDRYTQDNQQQQPGRFSGRGPRGYQRSDKRIHEDVCELLTRHGEVDASNMDVEVQRATVILRGMADSGRIRRLVEELVEDVPGVRDVQNELRVNQRTGNASGDFAGMAGDSSRMADRGDPREHGIPAFGVGVASTSGVSTRTGPGEPGISAGAGPSQHGNRWQVRETMDVVGSDGETIGTVKAVHGTDFHLDRPAARDLFVPFSAIRTVDGERLMLSVRADVVDEQHWPAPDLMGSNEGPVTR